MKVNKKLVLIAIFCVFCLKLFIFSVLSGSDEIIKDDVSLEKNTKKDSVSSFKKANYFLKDLGKPKLHLKARTMNMFQDNGLLLFNNPIGEAYTKDQRPVFYKAEEGFYQKNSGELELNGNVLIFTEESELVANKVSYNFKQNLFIGTQNVETKNYSLKTKDKIFISSDEVSSTPFKKVAQYRGNVNGRIERFKAYELPIKFEADQIDTDINKSHVVLTGNVLIRKQGVTARSRRGEIFLENYNKKLKYYALYDDVILNEKLSLGKKTIVRKAYAEKLEGLAREEKIILFGQPKVVQDGEVITGNKITIMEKNEVVIVDGAITKLKIK